MYEKHFRIDLHGCSVQDTKKILAHALEGVKINDLTQLYIITGWGKHKNSQGGRGVLKKVLPKLLRPYNLEIAAMHEEKGAYKIILSKQEKVAKQLVEKVFTNFPELKEENDQLAYVKTLEKEAQKENVESILALAILYLTEIVKDPQGVEKALAHLENARKLGSSDACVYLGRIYADGLKVPPDYQKAFAYYQEAAKAGDLMARLLMGKCYLSGEGIVNDDAAGFRCVKEAADAGLKEAQYMLAMSYLYGDFTPQDDKLFVEYCQNAAKQGMPSAQCAMARCYAVGQCGVKQDTQLAFEFYVAAAKQGDTYAMHQVGDYLTAGRLGKVNDEEGFEWYMKGAILNEPDCQAAVARGLYDGKGVKQNIDEAIKWAKKGAEQKAIIAYMILADAYAKGKGVEKDEVQAKKYRDMIASINEAQAGYTANAQKLQSIYPNLKFQSPSDWVNQFDSMDISENAGLSQNELILKAAKKGFILAQWMILQYFSEEEISRSEWKEIEQGFWSQPEDALLSLKDIGQKFRILDTYCMKDNLTDGQKNKVMKILHTLEKENHPSFCLKLANAYFQGKFIKQDIKKAAYYYQRAADLGSKIGLCNLGYLHEKGLEGKPDYQKAFACFSQAAEKGHADSHNQLGLYHKEGRGIEKNPNKAMIHFTEAMKLDSGEEKAMQEEEGFGSSPTFPNAAYNLGLLLIFDLRNAPGVSEKQKEDIEQFAVHWFMEAEKAGQKDAFRILNDLGVSKVEREKERDATTNKTSDLIQFWKAEKPKPAVEVLKPIDHLKRVSKQLGLSEDWKMPNTDKAWCWVDAAKVPLMKQYDIAPATLEETTAGKYIILINQLSKQDLTNWAPKLKAELTSNSLKPTKTN